MKVIATNKFKKDSVRPVELDYIPEENEVFNLTEYRAEELIAKGYVKEFEEPKEKPIKKEKNAKK